MATLFPSSYPWDHFEPQGISYFALPVFRFFDDKPMHCVALADGWNAQRLVVAHRDALFRSDVAAVIENGTEKQRWLRLLFRWDDVWAIYQNGRLRVYAPTRQAAVDRMTELRHHFSAGNPQDELPSPRRGPRTLED